MLFQDFVDHIDLSDNTTDFSTDSFCDGYISIPRGALLGIFSSPHLFSGNNDRSEMLYRSGRSVASCASNDLLSSFALEGKRSLTRDFCSFLTNVSGLGAKSGLWQGAINFMLEDAYPRYLYYSAEVCHPFSETALTGFSNRELNYFIAGYIHYIFNWSADLYRIIYKSKGFAFSNFSIASSAVQIEEDTKGKTYFHINMNRYYEERWLTIDKSIIEASLLIGTFENASVCLDNIKSLITRILNNVASISEIAGMNHSALSEMEAAIESIESLDDANKMQAILDRMRLEYESIRIEKATRIQPLEGEALLD